ncbi:MAG: fumarylacetoacetate hydrolase family protein [Kiritimatiellaeota bacterium]|nr:fumarylacetoacetate hydrolase family protein [Kiritimatiellota bacterium]
MKLVRFGPPAEERPGVWLDDTPAPGQAALLDVRAMAFDIEDFNAHFFAHHGLARLGNLLRENRRALIPAAGLRLGPPVARPGQIICLGKNYAAHAAEFDAEVPESPIFFSKAASALSGPYDPIVLPRGAVRVDGEAELAVVLGRRAHHVPEAAALDYVAGYTLINDVTDRDAQRLDRQWYRGKSADTFCPMGPFLAGPPAARRSHRSRRGSPRPAELPGGGGGIGPGAATAQALAGTIAIAWRSRPPRAQLVLRLDLRSLLTCVALAKRVGEAGSEGGLPALRLCSAKRYA